MPKFCRLGIPVIPVHPIWFMQKQILSAVYPQLKAELASSSSTFIYNNGFAQKAALGRFMMFVKYKIRMTWTFPFTQLHITHTYLYIQNPKQAHIGLK